MMVVNLASATPIPYISNDAPSDALLVYNTLVSQLNAAIAAGGSAMTPAFGDQVTGALTPAIAAAQILILVELRCITKMLDQGPSVTGSRNVMRAEELYTLTNTVGSI